MSTPNEQPTPGPVAWQKFGDKWCLTGQYGMRPIILSTDPKGNLKLRNAERDVLVPFDPSHPDAMLIADAFNSLATCRKALEDEKASHEKAIYRALTVQLLRLRNELYSAGGIGETQFERNYLSDYGPYEVAIAREEGIAIPRAALAEGNGV